MIEETNDANRFGWPDLLRLLLLVGLATLVLPTVGYGPRPTAAQERSVEWTRYDVTLDLRDDGSFHVEERQETEFSGGPFRRGFANIPLGMVEGIDEVVAGEVVDGAPTSYAYRRPSAYDEDPNTYTYETVGSELQVRWAFPPTSNQTRTFLLDYDVTGGLRVYPDAEPPFQQVWWIAIGPEVTELAPVREATATIRLPVAVDVAQSQATPGTPAEHTTDGKVWTWQASDLTGGESLEVGVAFPPIVNVVVPPPWQERIDAQERRETEAVERGAVLSVIFLGLGLFLAVGGGLGVYGLWYTRGRDPHTGLVADFLAAPPDDLPPGAAGTLLDEHADEQDIVATLVDLGHRGDLKIDESESPGFLGFGGGRDFKLTLERADPPVAPFERDLLNALFGFKLTQGATTNLSDVKQRFVTAQPEIRDKLYAELVRRGYFTRSPEATRSTWKTVGFVVVGVAIVAGCIGSGMFASVAPLVWFPVVVVVGLGAVLAFLSRALPRKTAAGAEAAARWRAFRKYLAEIERYEKLDQAKDIFDKYLPYAIAFGLEHSWVQKFAAVSAPTPAWYGGGGFGPLDGGHYPGRRYPQGGGTMVFPGGDWTGGGGGDRPGGGGGGGIEIPDLQETSDRGGRSLQSSSDGLSTMLNIAGAVFGAMAAGGGGGGGRSGWSGGGGFSGGGGGGGGGGGSRGFS